ncbi:hypothetical protein M8369_28655, partial [Klebsiella pneumoniae]|nr:hypothetical protein [Klebsiella pneumoniae]
LYLGDVYKRQIYACVRCSIVMAMQAGEKRICPRCANAEWSKASRAKRLT